MVSPKKLVFSKKQLSEPLKKYLTMEVVKRLTAWKVSKCGVFSSPSFLVFRLNMEIYRVNLSIQFKWRNIRTRKSSAFWHFSRCDSLSYLHGLSHTVVVFIWGDIYEVGSLYLWGEVWAIAVTQKRTPTLSRYVTNQCKVY